MHKLHDLKDLLITELEGYGDKTELSPGDLAVVDTLAHAAKNLCKVIDDVDGYSGRYDGPVMRSDRGGYNGGTSYARKRDRMGRYSSADYSRAADDVIGQLEDMMESAPDDRSRNKIRDLIREMKNV